MLVHARNLTIPAIETSSIAGEAIKQPFSVDVRTAMGIAICFAIFIFILLAFHLLIKWRPGIAPIRRRRQAVPAIQSQRQLSYGLALETLPPPPYPPPVHHCPLSSTSSATMVDNDLPPEYMGKKEDIEGIEDGRPGDT
ncbi:hypothetical protein BD410DRAFT_895803 [Rickenella mellea]|uniref:Uncharacterized protein n=1 Tax=Rickenella mellea TaxID=50990 RepID=A0A4Y7QCX7_9AGAM|nr:hypothetical protein BD410DRAFT_895803 [Rickenella mellea]